MHHKHIFSFGIILTLALGVVKLALGKLLGVDSSLFHYLVWAASFAGAAFLARRLGVINYLEAIYVDLLWLFLAIFTDWLITLKLLGLGLFESRWPRWSYLFLAVGIFFFHQKRHVQIRKELAAKKPSQGH